MKKKKVIATLLCILLLFSILGGITAGASPPPLMYISYAATNMGISSSGLVTICSDVDGYQQHVNMVVITIYLQRYVNGRWQNVPGAYWQETFHNYYGVLEITYQATSGYTYRGYTIFDAYNGSICEMLPLASGTQYY